MLGKTHIATGVATSLVILHPNSMTGVIATIAGGMIGGWICDLDCRTSEIDEGAIAGFILTGVFGTAVLAFDKFLGNGICEWFLNNVGIKSIVGIVLFLFCCMYGIASSHRTFMHSIAALLIMAGGMYLFCMPLAYSFGIGFISHLLLDITNKRGLQLFFPFRVKICMGVCDSNGTENGLFISMCGIENWLKAA